MRKRSLRFVGRLVVVGVLGALGVIASPRPAEAQAYPVRVLGPLNGTWSGFSCLDWKQAQANSPVSTSCWLLITWWVGSFGPFNRYERIGERVSTESFACPNTTVDHGSSVFRGQGPEALAWEAYIGGDNLSRFVSFLNGHCPVGGTVVRDLSLKGIDPTACGS
jgi:hypothetical protein